MPEAAIALGSNLGDRRLQLQTAIRHLEALGHVSAVSSFMDTAPVGYLDQPRFLNAVALLQTRLHAQELMSELLRIEQSLGRIREAVPAKGPRLIDLDLIFYDNLTLQSPGLTLPHPALHEREFVLGPLAELAPGWIHPLLGRSISELLAMLRPDHPL